MQPGTMSGGTTRMPNLSFLQLAKVFAAGFLGYVVLTSFAAFVVALAFPNFVNGDPLDMSIDMFFKTVFFHFGILGVVATLLMLVGAWCILRLFTRR